jgi:hypothetical protein
MRPENKKVQSSLSEQQSQPGARTGLGGFSVAYLRTLSAGTNVAKW